MQVCESIEQQEHNNDHLEVLDYNNDHLEVLDHNNDHLERLDHNNDHLERLDHNNDHLEVLDNCCSSFEDNADSLDTGGNMEDNTDNLENGQSVEEANNVDQSKTTELTSEDENKSKKRRRRAKVIANVGSDDDDDDEESFRGKKARGRRRGPEELFKFVHFAEGPGGEYFCRFPGCLYADSFRSLTNCKNHQLAQHATDAEKVFACEACAERFASQRLHNKHVNQAHNMRFACEVCGRKFAERTRLRIHSRVHTGEKPFVCEQCGYSCTQRDNLKKHKGTVHRELRPRFFRFCMHYVFVRENGACVLQESIFLEKLCEKYRLLANVLLIIDIVCNN